MFYYMHNNNNYQCKMCWNKALTFGVGFIITWFSCHCVHPIHAKVFSIQLLLHFSQIVPRVCTFFFRFLCNFTCDVSEALMLAMRVLFCSSLSKVCSCVSEPLMLAMRVLFFSCLRNLSSIDFKALLRSTGLQSGLLFSK